MRIFRHQIVPFGLILIFLKISATAHSEVEVRRFSQTGLEPVHIGQSARADLTHLSSSEWTEREADFYLELFKDTKYDLLLLPFESDAAPLDYAARHYMSYRLARALGRTTGKQLPDVGLIEQALGIHKRKWDLARVKVLADKLGSALVIKPRVGYRHAGILISLEILHFDGQAFTPSSKIDAPREWAVRFLEGSTSAIRAFDAVLHKMVESILGRPIKPVEATLPAATNATKSLQSLESILAAPTILSVDSLWTMQLFALALPEALTHKRVRLIARALAMAVELGLEKPPVRSAAAFAMHHLWRRPDALKLVAEISRPSDSIALALLESNLNRDPEQLLKQIKAIDNVAERLVAHLSALQFLRNMRPSDDLSALERAFAEDSITPDWRQWFKIAIDEAQTQPIIRPEEAKRVLDERYPVVDLRLDNILRSHALAGGSDRGPEAEFVLVAAAVNDHAREFMLERSGRWCCRTTNAGLTPLDELAALKDLGAASLLRRAEFLSNFRGQSNAALKLLDRARDTFEGHPLEVAGRARAYCGSTVHGNDRVRAQRRQRCFELSLKAIALQGSQFRFSSVDQSNFSRKLRSLRGRSEEAEQWYTYVQAPAIGFDFPTRPYWRFARPLVSLGTNPIDYAIYDTDHLDNQLSILIRNKKLDEARILFERHAHRYSASPKMLNVKVKYARATGREETVRELLQEAVNERVNDWEPYSDLALVHAGKSRYGDALEVFLAFPGFEKTKRQNRVYAANLAASAARELHWRGAVDEARVLLELSVSYGTGSQQEGESQWQLAILNRDWQAAVKVAFHLANRYRDRLAIGNYLELLRIFGYRDEAWAGLNSVIGDGTYVAPFLAANAIHKMDGAGEAQILSWLRTKTEVLVPRYESQIARHAMWALAMDRTPSSTLIEFVREMNEPALESWFKAEDGSETWRIDGEIFADKIRQDTYAGRRAKSDLELFARGYRALKLEQYKAAFDYFSEWLAFFGTRSFPKGRHVLSYFTIAAIEIGEMDFIRRYLESVRQNEKPGFDHALGLAFLAAADGDDEQALRWLEYARNHREGSALRPLHSSYQLAEAVYWLFQRHGDVRYRDFALSWLWAMQALHPFHGWMYALEARLAIDSNAKIRALGYALFFDQHSQWLNGFTEEQKRQAREAFNKNPPFDISDEQNKHGA